MRLPRKSDYGQNAREFRSESASRSKLHRGDKILVVLTDFDGAVVDVGHARVMRSHRGRVTARTVGAPFNTHSRGNLYRRHEGRTWARGWDTPAAVVLSAEISLLVSR